MQLCLFRECEIYDGVEPQDWNLALPSPPEVAALGIQVTMADLSFEPLSKLESAIDAKTMQHIIATSGVLPRKLMPGWVDRRGLSTYFCWCETDGGRVLLISALGEYQPARYRAWLLSAWRPSTPSR